LGGGVLIGLCGLYMSGHESIDSKGFVWDLGAATPWAILLSLFIVINLLPVFLILIIDYKNRVLGDKRPLVLVALLFLTLLALYKFGQHADLRLQASAPAIVLVVICTVSYLIGMESLKKGMSYYLLIGVLGLGTLYPALRPFWNLYVNKGDQSYAGIGRALGWKELVDMRSARFDIVPQYMGNPSSFASTFILKRRQSEVVPPSLETSSP